MKNTTDMRNKELQTKVRDNEDVLDAIIRYMKRNGYKTDTWTDGKGLVHRYFYNSTAEFPQEGDYRDLWIAGTCFSETTKIVKFQLDGNK